MNFHLAFCYSLQSDLKSEENQWYNWAFCHWKGGEAHSEMFPPTHDTNQKKNISTVSKLSVVFSSVLSVVIQIRRSYPAEASMEPFGWNLQQ